MNWLYFLVKPYEVADLSPIFTFWETKRLMVPMDLYIGDSRVWRLDSGPDLQPCSLPSKYLGLVVSQSQAFASK